MYLNLVQLAESFGVSEKLVLDWVRSEELPHVLDRGSLLFDRAQVAKWAAGRGLTAQAGFLASEKGPMATEFTLADLLRAGGIWRDVSAAEVAAVFARVIASMEAVPASVRALLDARLRARNGISWAPVGGGFALPHFTSQVSVGRESGRVALVLLRDPLQLPEPPVDGVPVTRLLFFVPPSPRAHLDTLGRLARALSKPSLREALASGAGDEELLRAVAAADAPSPPSPGSRNDGSKAR